jgi:hypothetical protein
MTEKYFNLGDTVTWSSQAKGYHRTKIGEVVAKIPGGDKPPHVTSFLIYTMVLGVALVDTISAMLLLYKWDDVRYITGLLLTSLLSFIRVPILVRY